MDTARESFLRSAAARFGRPFPLLCLLLGAIAMNATAVQERTIDFDADDAGTLPAGWSAGITGHGVSHWVVARDDTAPSPPHVLEQDATGTFPWCVLPAASLADGFVEVKLKPISGREDQAGGVVWRWKDGGSYYVARANAMEDNVSLYYTEGGVRKTIKYVDAPVKRGAWHTLRVEFRAQRIRVILDGVARIEVDDAHIAGPGAVGLWTKADSRTRFDDFRYGGAAP
jgi:hypothetical protein